jgi:hypothetical protein
MGFKILATSGTAKFLRARGIPAERVLKVYEGRPNGIDLMVNGQVQLLINTPLGKQTDAAGRLRHAARRRDRSTGFAYTTTMSAAPPRATRSMMKVVDDQSFILGKPWPARWRRSAPSASSPRRISAATATAE